MKYNQSILYNMSFLELIGAIFVRSQLIEQVMRELIMTKKGYSLPDDFDRKTFGWLLNEFSKLYPEVKVNKAPLEWQQHHDMSLYASLKDAKEVRDSAAHGDYLAHITAKDLMPAKDGKGIDRLTTKAARKSAMVMDAALIEVWNFRAGLMGSN
jgi:hypothetical protein